MEKYKYCNTTKTTLGNDNKFLSASLWWKIAQGYLLFTASWGSRNRAVNKPMYARVSANHSLWSEASANYSLEPNQNLGNNSLGRDLPP